MSFVCLVAHCETQLPQFTDKYAVNEGATYKIQLNRLYPLGFN